MNDEEQRDLRRHTLDIADRRDDERTIPVTKEEMARRPLQLLRNGAPLPEPVSETRDTRAASMDIVGEERDRPFRLDQLSGPELGRVMTSVEQMAQAQVTRFKAAGVVAFIFDSSGMSAMSLVRPDEGGVTDDYVLGALEQYVKTALAPEETSTPKRKKKR